MFPSALPPLYPPADPLREIRFHDYAGGRQPEELANELLKLGFAIKSESGDDPRPGVIQNVDLRSCLESWPYDPASNVHIGRGADGRQIILVRQPMGLQQFEMDGRPDGGRIDGEETVLHFHDARLNATQQTQPAMPFALTAGDCADLFREANAFYDRLVLLFHMKDWFRVRRDVAQILRILEFVECHSCCIEDHMLLGPWRPYILRIDIVAHAMAQLDHGGSRNALQTARKTAGLPDIADHCLPDVQALTRVLMEKVGGVISQVPAFHPHGESGFLRKDDFWTIRYRGQSALLKTSKGLECLVRLLRSPDREFHVSELVACRPDTSSSRPAASRNSALRQEGGHLVMASRHNGIPLLDLQAKAECKRRLDDLREQEDESERFNDPDRSAKVRAEINAIAEYLAATTGLGGRDRKTSSEAERARCAVTKRIKQAIPQIAAVLPALGHHLTARIKTGYFCSYNPHPDRPVPWKF